jgi:branched-chain amino acid transport system substrate-binding protein
MRPVFKLWIASLMTASTLVFADSPPPVNLPVKIGFVAPLSGDVAAYGEEEINGVKLALEEINAHDVVIDPIFADDEGKPEKTVNLVKKFIELDQVAALIGTPLSSTTLAAAKYAQESEIPLMTPSATNDRITDCGEYISRICFIDSFQGSVMARFAVEKMHLKKGAILIHQGNDYSEGISKNFRTEYERLGGQIIYEDRYRSGDNDFSVLIEKAKNSGCEVLFIPGYYTEVGPMIKQGNEAWKNIVLMGGDGWDSPDIFKLGNFSGLKAYMSSHFSSDDQNPQVQSFVKKYTEKYGKKPGAMAALGYDAAKIMAWVIVQGNDDSEEIKKAIHGLKNYPGVTGSITLNEKRNAEKEAVIMKVTQTGFEFVGHVSPS